MQIGAIRHKKEILLSNGEATAVILILVLSVVLALTAGHFIGLGAGKVINKIVDHAEGRVDDCGCDEAKRNFVPILVPDEVESHDHE